MSNHPPIQLDYARPLAWYDRKLPIKQMIRLAIVAALVASGFALREPIGRRWDIMRLERECGSYVLSKDAVFYSDMTRSLTSTKRTQSPMGRYLRTAPVPFLWPAGADAFFGHWLRSAGGTRRLLIMTVSGQSNESCMTRANRVGCVINFVLMPRSSLGSLRESDARIFQLFTEMPIERQGLELRDARIDPSDTSRISFTFETRDSVGKIIAELQNDGTLKFIEHPQDIACPWMVGEDLPRGNGEVVTKVPVVYVAEADSTR